MKGEYFAFEEIFPRKSGRHALKVVCEEQCQKYILLGSQKTLPNMMGGGSRNPSHTWKCFKERRFPFKPSEIMIVVS
jgi:hypothetical protein